MSIPKNVADKIREQEQQMSLLRTERSILEVKASQFHHRLLTTLDALDQLQLSHNAETAQLKRSNYMLEQKVLRLQARLTEVKSEYDDMREAVESLIEKVELANGFHSLSHSALQISYLTEPSESLRINNEAINGISHDQVVHSLTDALEEEKKLRTNIQNVTKAQIDTLRAMVARRDAELEELILNGFGPSKTGDSGVEDSRASNGEALSILPQASDRNRALEREIELLCQELDAAKARKLSHAPPSAEETPRYHSSLETPELVPTASAASDATFPTMATRAESHIISNPATPKMLDSPIKLPEPLPFFSTPESQRPSPKTEANTSRPRVSSVFLPATPPTGTMRKPGSSTPMRQVPGALLDVRRQIEDLGPDVRDLTTEQEHLGAALRLSHLTSPRPSLQDMESIWLLEEECIRLRAAALAAEEKAESAIAQAMELRAVIRSLEDQLQMASPLAGAGTEGSTDTSDYDTEGETLNPSEILSSVLYSDNASEATSYGEGGIARSAASTLSTSMLVADKLKEGIDGAPIQSPGQEQRCHS